MGGAANLHRLAAAQTQRQHEAATGPCAIADCTERSTGYIQGADFVPKGICRRHTVGAVALDYTVHPDPLPLPPTTGDTTTMTTASWTTAAPATIGVDDAQPITMYTTTVHGEPWVLLGWVAAGDPRPEPTDAMNWSLGRRIAGPWHHHSQACTAAEALTWADDTLAQAYSPEVVAANERGENCSLGNDPRHNVTRCPGLHT